VFKRKPKMDETAAAKGSSGDAADAAVEGRPQVGDHTSDTPHARLVKPLAEGEKHDQMADKEAEAESHEEALLEEGLEESYPASDPVSANHFT
jgi:hypothetical protein